ncbi:PAS domain S-box protein [Sinimarinibacterium sp. CAU 1509]|uniref:HD domain-containing phosphohydrolase n=1 Tax=Sinimarinibacterium sp. CAU 1509 TaxID=2562283 RepID=UPI0010AC1D76|nr:HD domain-containing phosphohydrolase [Sinimarinibacterium sp. CAU 1509]TJY59004.1 PAS domain S-box protein [Sinimarinibacterium sp. CAU 1509]
MNARLPFMAALIEDVSDFVAVLDADGQVRYVSESIESIGGYRPEQLKGHVFVEFVHQDDWSKSLATLRAALDQPDRTHTCECRLRHRDGGWRIIQASVRDRRAVRDIRGIVVTARDITELREAQQREQAFDEQMRLSLLEAVGALAAAAEARDEYTAGHQRRVADLSGAIAQELKYPDARRQGLMLAASIHDIGKLKVPIEILTKQSRLSDLEYALVQTHVTAAAGILGQIRFPWPVAKIVEQHHERLDGSGYPHQLRGDQIMQEACIVAVADTVESMTNQRPYRRGLGIDHALAEIERGCGRQYDAAVVHACLHVFRDLGYTFAEY